MILSRNPTLAASVSWHLRHFTELSATEVYQLARLRVDVFVVEQACAYAELDGLDLLDDTTHLFANLACSPIAYARILAPRPADPEPLPLRIGRVVVAQSKRRQGLASALMQRALEHCQLTLPGHDQTLAAQLDAVDLYAKLGFTVCSDPYMDDGIAHVDMHRPAALSLR